MDKKFYQEFYTKAVLPQFGFNDAKVAWGAHKRVGPDEFAWAFEIDGTDYILIFEDYDGLGRHEEYIRENVTGKAKFTFVEPTSKSLVAPSYNGFKLPVPYKYIEHITGTFTLIKLLEKEDS
jgi:hypothetical protein